MSKQEQLSLVHHHDHQAPNPPTPPPPPPPPPLSELHQSYFLGENFIEVVFLLLGVGVLLPWNAYVSAKPYFQSRLCVDQDSFVSGDVELWFSVLYNGASVVSLAAVVFAQYCCDGNNSTNNSNNDDDSDQSSLFRIGNCVFLCKFPFFYIRHDDEERRTRQQNSTSTTTTSTSGYAWYMVMIPLAIYLAVFSITTILVFLPSLPPRLFLLLTLVGLVICGVCTSVATSGIVGTAGLFKANIGINPYFNGQAAGGLFVAVANFVATMFSTGSSSTNFIQQMCGGGSSSSSTLLVLSSSSHDDGDAAMTLLQQDDDDDNDLECIPYSEISWATAAYFFWGCVVLAACMVGYQYVDRYERHTRVLERSDSLPSSSTTVDDDDDDDDIQQHKNVEEDCSTTYTRSDSLVDDCSSSRGSTTGTSSSSSYYYDHCYESYQNNNNEIIPQSLSSSNVTELDTNSQEVEGAENVTLSVWRVVRGPAVSLFWTYFVTLAIFPAWTSELASTRQCESTSRLSNDLYTPMSFIVFNLGDLLGRMVSAEIHFEGIHNLSSKLVFASISRFGFFVLFLLCRAQNSQFNNDDWAIQSDALSWLIQLLFAITNGALTNVAFCYAPGLVENEKHPQQVASAILNFSLCFGLLCGSLFSFPYVQFAVGS